jgi:lipopolysaccharide/colanic/teichoic acid biosynthesis glycosyltransferase
MGRFLQATKIDELPQLYNVIRGKMSLIGPRPETPVFAGCFVGKFERVLDFKPGILGPSQVLFRNESQIFSSSASPEQLYRDYLFPLKANIDLDYYCRRTLIGDIAWLARGIFAVIWGGQKSIGNAPLPMQQTPQKGR